MESQGYRIRLDLSRQALQLDLLESGSFGRQPGRVEAPLQPTFFGALRDGFVPLSVLVQKAKQFDDGLYAAVEIAAQNGAGGFKGKSTLLQGLAARLAQGSGSDGTLAMLAAAARLGGLAVPAAATLEPAIDRHTSAFLADEARSKPLGFYTWSTELEGIFRQDRLLQSELEENGAAALASALRADPSLAGTYRTYLELIGRLTNPLSAPDLRPLLADAETAKVAPRAQKRRLFPPSVSHEATLIQKLYGDKPIPDGFSLVDEMIGRIRSGLLALAPTPDSGWYDYQTWSHEPMVIPEKMPEAAHLSITDSYRRALLELFKGAQALARETHVKQLAIPMPGSAMGRPTKQPTYLVVSPDLSAEPSPSYYLRRALGYGLVRSALSEVFGEAGLSEMRRIGPDGAARRDLGGELAATQSLFWGAYYAACEKIGLVPDASLPGASQASEHAARFETWSRAVDRDADLSRDARMMVPVFYDRGRGQMKVWAFLGWVTETLSVKYATPPEAAVFDRAGRAVSLGDDVKLVFGSETHTVAYPVTAEVYVSRILNRDEFRKHCDRHKTRSAILANLR